MLRIACYRFVAKGGLERGFLLAGPVHDALLVDCAIEDEDEATEFTKAVMAEASRAVLNGFELGVDVKVWRYPNRFMDEKRGRGTWDRIMKHLARAEAGHEVRCKNGYGFVVSVGDIQHPSVADMRHPGLYPLSTISF
jgi:DNA polymerase I